MKTISMTSHNTGLALAECVEQGGQHERKSIKFAEFDRARDAK